MSSLGKHRRSINENPLSGPYQFEGIVSAKNSNSLKYAKAVENNISLDTVHLLVIRTGENSFGTWGTISVKQGTKWESKGFTLEPKSTVGKGPIPLGVYPFRQWASPTLQKTLRLSNVQGFLDILVHVGNTQGDTVGCILAGRIVDSQKAPTHLLESRILVDWLYDNCPEGSISVQSK
jgi:hypothetical protein